MTYLIPNWPAPNNIKAFTTLRTFTDSPIQAQLPYLKSTLDLPTNPIWVKQVHGNKALAATNNHIGQEADALFSELPQQVCLVLTADCLPILLCQQQGNKVAAIHAGWRGLASGVIENTIAALEVPPHELMAWLGPAISQQHFEVGQEVYDLFLQHDSQAIIAFIPSPNAGRWMADLYALARLRLNHQGITAIYGGEYCTYADSTRFYSYRREGASTGRMASLIYRK